MAPFEMKFKHVIVLMYIFGARFNCMGRASPISFFESSNFGNNVLPPFRLTHLAHLILFIYVVNVLKLFRGLLYIMFFKSNDVSPYLLTCA